MLGRERARALRPTEEQPSDRSQLTRDLGHSIVSTYDVVGLLNEPDATDFGLLGSLASKHDMIVLILDDPEE